MTESTVGVQLTSAQVDVDLQNLAVGFRQLAQQALNLSLLVNGQGNGQAVLEAAGYTDAAAATALTAIGYFNNVGEVWFGQAALAQAFNFNNASAPYWGNAI